MAKYLSISPFLYNFNYNFNYKKFKYVTVLCVVDLSVSRRLSSTADFSTVTSLRY